MAERDRVVVTTVVAVSPARAFAVFTGEIDAWWGSDEARNRFRADRRGRMRFEPGVGGRLLEEYAEAPDDPWEVGRIRVWQPPERLVFGFRAAAFARHEATEVEVRFEPVPGGTRVTVEHRGWDALPPDHPVRHGLLGPAFESMMGLWWADRLEALRARGRLER